MIKNWTVDIGDWCGGHFEHFFTKKSALDYAMKNWNSGLYINLKHKDERIRIKDDPESKQGEENCKHHWVGEFGQVRCDKCNATMKIACNHTGSVGCQSCSQEYANELNKKHSKFDKEHNKWKKKGDFCMTCGLELKNNSCINPYCYDKIILKGEK